MSIASALAAITAKVGTDSGLDAKLRFDCGAEGSIFIDGTAIPNTVSAGDGPADCVIKITLTDLEAMLAGDLKPTAAFMSGRLKAEGDIAVAMRLSRVI